MAGEGKDYFSIQSRTIWHGHFDLENASNTDLKEIVDHKPYEEYAAIRPGF